MDADERALLEESVVQALASIDGSAAAADAALAELGWLEMLREEPVDAVAVVLRALGTTNAAASALDDVMVAALGLEPSAELTVLLPSFGWTDAPGRDGDGMATARVATASDVIVVSVQHEDTFAVRVPTARITQTPIGGVDPGLGLSAAS